ncbi:hypothetical protein acdb102_32070 [Acidothermaceae bacterium B102]|nr:hypothetical protein acdb102_32070 [Acidothermaceae bacterium B102]
MVVPPPALAAVPSWTKLSLGGIGSFNETGLLRTSDGKLHVVWEQDDAPSDASIRSAVLSPAGKILTRGVVVQHWLGLETTPKLVPWGGGVAVVFNGDQDANAANPYSVGARYWATSTDGNVWALQPGSLANHTVVNSTIAATTEADGTLVTVQGLNSQLFYDVGSNIATPSPTLDGVIGGQSGSGLASPQIVRAADGSVWVGWYQIFESNQGYWVQQILPTVGAPVRAPSSFNANQINSPNQQVAMVARPSGGVYLAYCEPIATAACAKVGLWKVGSAKAATVPGSTAGNLVSLSNGPGGRLEIGWFSQAAGKVNVVWTNRSVTKFSGARTLNAVPSWITVHDLFVDGTKGPVDLLSNEQLTTTGYPIAIFHTQLLPALKLTVSPATFSHTSKATLTFKVTDVGDPVPGVKVTFDGKSARTNAKGIAVIKLPKGVARAKRTAVARVTNWQAASTTVTTN